MFFQLGSSLFKKNWSFQSEEYLPLKHAVALNQFCMITFWQILLVYACFHPYLNSGKPCLSVYEYCLSSSFSPWMKNIYPYEHRTSWKFWHDYTVLQIITFYAMVVLHSYFLIYETQQMILKLCLSVILLLILFWFVLDLLRL